MKIHYSEEFIEMLAMKLAQPGSTLNDEEMEFMDHSILCDLCGNKLNIFCKFYDIYNEEIWKLNNQRAEELFNIVYPNYISLKYVNISLMQSLSEKCDDMVLAADSNSKVTKRYADAALFSSKDNSLILKVIEDKEREMYIVYIITNDVQLKKENIISIKAEDNVFYACTNENGKSEISAVNKINWMGAEIKLLLATKEYLQVNLFSKRVLYDDKINIKPLLGLQNMNLIVLIKYSDGSFVVQKLNDNYEFIIKKEIIKIKIFNWTDD
jgi:hypothetical protein